MTTTAPTRATSTPTAPAVPDGTHPLQRAGGVAALVTAATYVAGIGLLGAYLAPRGLLDAQDDPERSLALLLDHQALLYSWHAVLYLVGGLALVSLVLGVHHRLRPRAPALSSTAGAVGHLWAGLLLASGLVALVGQRAVVDLAATDPEAAASTWTAVGVVQTALGGGVEVVGAAWVLLVGTAALRTRALGRGPALLGLAIGAAGTLTVVPAAAEYAGAAFGVGLVVWFVWVGLTLLRQPRA